MQPGPVRREPWQRERLELLEPELLEPELSRPGQREPWQRGLWVLEQLLEGWPSELESLSFLPEEPEHRSKPSPEPS